MEVSALILTLNEELNLERCLKSLWWCDDIVVLDSFSTDATGKIAESYKVRFYQRKFDDYANQRNYGISCIAYKHQWILMVDADEVVTSALADEISAIPADSSCNMPSLYRVKIKYYFMGQWIKHSSGYPTWYGRLLRRDRVLIDRSINEHCTTEDAIGYLNNHLDHYPFNKGFHAWLEKHNRYSTMEAEVLSDELKKNILFRNLFHSDPLKKRKALKQLVYSLPCRPALMFLALYILRLGFLDGKAGFTYCTLRMFYEYMIDCKIKEINLHRKGLPL